MILMKFGKKEHLEQLRNGMVHFRPIEYFQNEETAFRGDAMEGKLFLDPNKPFSINGHDYTDLIKEAIISYIIEGEMLSFSAAMLNKRNCHLINSELYTPNSDFINEMTKFGEYCLLFNGHDFVHHLRATLDRIQANYEWHPIFYHDKHDYDGIHAHFDSLTEERKQFCSLFIKGTEYSNQHEWRMVIFDTRNQFPISDTGGVSINTEFTTQMPVIEAQLLHTLTCDESFLFD